MSNTHEVLCSPEEVSRDLVDLAAAVAELPGHYRKRFEPILERAVLASRRRRRVLSQVQQALAQLRLDTAYLMFDLEATRRERDALQQERL